MNYIVLDLEWNQSPLGKEGEVESIPFEIIEIGAVKLDSEHREIARFREIVRPVVYTELHYKTKEIIMLRSIDFENARSFGEIIPDFFAWCGSDPCFCTWGPADLTELQRNLAYHQIRSPFPFPLMYFDIQKIFSIVFEDRKSRRSLEYAVDFLHIPKRIAFHSALSDAYYTSLVMKKLTEEQIQKNSSIDYFHTPANRRQEIYLKYDTYTKFISKPFETRTAAMKDRIVTSTICCACKRNASKKIRWFATGGHNYCALAYCEEHGYLKGKIRLRQRSDGKIFAIKTLKLISPEDAYLIREKKEIVKLKRRLRREFSRQNRQM